LEGSDKSKWLVKVYSAKGNKELAEGYDDWAKDYDQDVLSFGYNIPSILCGLVGRYLNRKDNPILDAGVGTGILGEVLSKIGYTRLIGIDLSQGMLEIARKKGIYSDLKQMILGETLEFSDNAFTATVSMGTFTVGHAPPDAFDELIRITEPAGYIIFSVRTDDASNEGFQEKQNHLEARGKWKLVEKSSAFQGLPLTQPEIENEVYVYKVS